MGTSSPSSSSPISYSEAINKAKASTETEKKGDTPAQTNPAAFQPRKTDEEDDNDDEEVEITVLLH